jgi:hypothetical protein
MVKVCQSVCNNTQHVDELKARLGICFDSILPQLNKPIWDLMGFWVFQLPVCQAARTNTYYTTLKYTQSVRTLSLACVGGKAPLKLTLESLTLIVCVRDNGFPSSLADRNNRVWISRAKI